MPTSKQHNDDPTQKHNDRRSLDYQDEDDLREALEEEGSITSAAERFDAAYSTVRYWMIKKGLHEPEEREYVQVSGRLEAIGRRTNGDVTIRAGDRA